MQYNLADTNLAGSQRYSYQPKIRIIKKTTKIHTLHFARGVVFVSMSPGLSFSHSPTFYQNEQTSLQERSTSGKCLCGNLFTYSILWLHAYTVCLFFFYKSCILFFGKARARQARTLAFSLCLPHPCDGKGIIIIIYGSEPPCTARQCALRDWRRGVFDVRADWRSLTLRFGQTIFGLRITEILLHILNFTNEAKGVEVLCFDCETTDSLRNWLKFRLLECKSRNGRGVMQSLQVGHFD